MTVERAGPSGARVRRAGGPSGGRGRRAGGPSGGRGRRAGGSVGLYDAPGRQPGGGRGENALHSAAAGYMAAASLQSAFSPHRNHGSSSAEPADPPQGAPRGGRVVSRRPRVRQGHPAGNVRATRSDTSGPPGQERQATRPSTRRPRTGNATATWPGTPGPPGRARQGHATRHTRPTRSGTRGRRLRWATPGAGCSGLGRERPRTPPAAARSAPSSPRARPHRPGPRRR